MLAAVINLTEHKMYASGANLAELLDSWNENIEEKLQWVLEEDYPRVEEIYEDITQEACYLCDIESTIDFLNTLSGGNFEEIGLEDLR